ARGRTGRSAPGRPRCRGDPGDRVRSAVAQQHPAELLPGPPARRAGGHDHRRPRPGATPPMTPAPPPQGDYAPAVRHGQLILTAGMTSRVRGLPAFLGAIGAELDEEDGRRAVRIAARNAADAVRSLLHPGEGVAAVLRTTVYLVCSPG